MTEIVFSVLVVLDIFPFEGIAAAARWVSEVAQEVRLKASLPATFFANSSHQVHGEDVL